MARWNPKQRERELLKRIGSTLRTTRRNVYREERSATATRAGISTQYLWKIEEGSAHNISLLLFIRVAEAMGCCPSLLLASVLGDGSHASLSRLHGLVMQLEQLNHRHHEELSAALTGMLGRSTDSTAHDSHQLALPFRTIAGRKQRRWSTRVHIIVQ